MSKIKTLFFRVSDKLDKVKDVVKLHQDGIIPEEEIRQAEEEGEKLKVLEYENKEVERKPYRILDELPEEAKVLGYVRINKKEDKEIKVKIDDLACSIDHKVPVNEKKKTLERVVGYVRVDTSTLEDYDDEGKEIYIALTKYFVLPFILLFFSIGLIGCMLYMSRPSDEPIKVPEREGLEEFVDGDKSQGEIEDEEYEFAVSPSFRMKLNCTPTMEKIYGKQSMNLRLESPKGDNKGLAFVTVVYLLSKQDAQGNIVEDYSDEPIEIYQSPVIYEDENVEFCELNKGVTVESGVYTGRALYYIYDAETMTMMGQTASKLRITVQ